MDGILVCITNQYAMEEFMEYPDLTEVAGRSKRYWTVDGIPEIVLGALWIVWGAGFLLQNAIPEDSRLADVGGWLILISMVATGIAADQIIKALKNKYTFPRGGYVKFSPPPQSQRILTMIAAALTAVVLSVLFVFASRGRFDANVLSPVFGALMALGFLFGSRKPGMRHFVWFSLMSLALGGALYPLKLGWMALPWIFIVMGVPSVVAGVCRLRSYVRNIPVQGGNES